MEKINKCGCGGSLPIEVFEQAEFKAYCVICRTCGCKGGTAPDKISAIRYWNTAHPENIILASVELMKKTLEDQAVKEWNEKTENHIISNAMQAVKVLEGGDKIIPVDFRRDRQHINTRFNNRCFGFGYCDGDTNKIVGYDIHNTRIQYPYLELTLTDLFSHVWQLYEEPKYREVDFYEAIRNISENGVEAKHMAFNEFTGKEVEYTLSLGRDGTLSFFYECEEKDELISDEIIYSTCITRDLITSSKWRIYE